jgi:hypothetical protein
MPNTPRQELRKGRFEALIGLAAPALDLVLAAGERFSSIVAPRGADDYIAIRPPGEKLELGSIRATRAQAAAEPPVE